MKRITLLSLAVCGGLLLQPALTFGEDQAPDKKTDAKKAERAPHEGKTKSVPGKDIQKGTEHGAASRVDKSSDKVSTSSAEGFSRSRDMATENKQTTVKDVRQSSQRKSSKGPAAAFAVQGNRSNHYNGQWIAGYTHSDWSRDGDHHWNDHDYRWYDGGWIIIDLGPSPDYTTASIGSSVQASLTQQGYYHGVIDGNIGRGTRHAIARYESDNGLQVNGRIDGPLLASLRLD
jgi:hypothetical protein